MSGSISHPVTLSLVHPFTFSQASLQDYVDCRRRFQLRYLLKVHWPALESEPAIENERAMQQGAQFHRLVQQHLVGIPAERLTSLAQGDDLRRWWQNYLQFQALSDFENLVGSACHPEMTLATPLKGQRLIAKYDLLLTHPDGRLTIYDWKTSRKKPKRQWLLDRLQSRVYPYVLARATSFSFASPLEMIYWFAEDPHNAEKITYSSDKFAQDEAHLASLIDEIAGLSPENFHLTAREERCCFCAYRSLCDRGRGAGSLEEMEEEAEAPVMVDFDFEQIAEISF